jgi:hypothetical protein
VAAAQLSVGGDHEVASVPDGAFPLGPVGHGLGKCVFRAWYWEGGRDDGDHREFAELARYADRLNVPASSLARGWILSQLRPEEDTSPAAAVDRICS